MLQEKSGLIVVISGLLILCLVLNPVPYQTLSEGAEAQNQDSKSAAGPLIGVLEFNDEVYRINHYGSDSFAHYFHRGDNVTFHGFIERVGDWDVSLDALAQVTITAPDDSRALFQNMTTDSTNKFEVAFPISRSAPIGRYMAEVKPISAGSQLGENRYVTQFFVLRNSSLDLTVPSLSDGPLKVSLGSLEYELKDASYENSNKTLRLIVEKAATIAPTRHISFADTQLDYPYFVSELMVDKRLRDGPNRIWVNGVPVGSGLVGNDKYADIQLFVDDLNKFSGPITLVISGYENN